MNDNQKAPKLDRKLILQRQPVDGQNLKELVAAAMAWLNTNKQLVNFKANQIHFMSTWFFYPIGIYKFIVI